MKKQTIKRMKDEMKGKEKEVRSAKEPVTRLKAFKNVGTLAKDMRTKIDAAKKVERKGAVKAKAPRKGMK